MATGLYGKKNLILGHFFKILDYMAKIKLPYNPETTVAFPARKKSFTLWGALREDFGLGKKNTAI